MTTYCKNSVSGCEENTVGEFVDGECDTCWEARQKQKAEELKDNK